MFPELAPEPFRANTAAEALPGTRAARARARRILTDKPVGSPYHGIDATEWVAQTQNLIDQYPLSPGTISDIVLTSWDQIFTSNIGGFAIGEDILPSPQIMGSFLHELIPLNLSRMDPSTWRRQEIAGEKDIVCLIDDRFSTEIKTSSHPRQIFGNRSYAQITEGDGKKLKSGYYIAVNFTGFVVDENRVVVGRPSVKSIRFGWLDHGDWAGQVAASGQQASLSPVVEDLQLLTIYRTE